MLQSMVEEHKVGGSDGASEMTERAVFFNLQLASATHWPSTPYLRKRTRNASTERASKAAAAYHPRRSLFFFSRFAFFVCFQSTVKRIDLHGSAIEINKHRISSGGIPSSP
jgi:hypothetical protein